jgi:hypothetical protein
MHFPNPIPSFPRIHVFANGDGIRFQQERGGLQFSFGTQHRAFEM